MRGLTIVVLILASFAGEARGEPVKSLRLLLPPQPNPVVETSPLRSPTCERLLFGRQLRGFP
jgi:hypothetical protein